MLPVTVLAVGASSLVLVPVLVARQLATVCPEKKANAAANLGTVHMQEQEADRQTDKAGMVRLGEWANVVAGRARNLKVVGGGELGGQTDMRYRSTEWWMVLSWLYRLDTRNATRRMRRRRRKDAREEGSSWQNAMRA